MKLYFFEVNHQYHQYLFPYQVVAFLEKDEEKEKLYGWGFLPFRNNPQLFYLARSSRCRLRDFVLSSENRRIIKKTNQFVVKKISLENFPYSFSLQKECKDWARQRGWKISTASIKKIFTGGFFTDVWVWFLDGERVGYQIIFTGKKLIHTGYIFYNSQLTGKDLGMRMLIEATLWAKEEGKEFHYLGTSYGKTGFYKRNLKGFEFFTGFGWSDNWEEWKYFEEKKEKYLLWEEEYWEKFWQGEKGKFFAQKGFKIDWHHFEDNGEE